jgi:DNA recombination protein RmuC
METTMLIYLILGFLLSCVIFLFLFIIFKKQIFGNKDNISTNSFDSISKEALLSNNKIFLDLAKSELEKTVLNMKNDFEKRHEAIDNTLKPVHEIMKKYEEQISRLEENRKKDQGSIEEQIKNLMDNNYKLQKETNNLVTALRTPHIRGRWGEMTLKRVVELSGMSEHCDFKEQESVTTEDDSRLRPDLIVHLPNNRIIIVDSKVPLDAYLDSISKDNENEKKEALVRHSRQVSDHVKKLSEKSYWEQFKDNTPEFVIMFIPAESFFSAALEIEKNLIEKGIENKVMISTPITLITLLRTVAYGWRNEKIAQNALMIQKLGATMYERLCVFAENFTEIGDMLKKTNNAYNKSIGSFDTRLMPAAKKFNELGILLDKKKVEDLEKIDINPRELKISIDIEEDEKH